MANSVHPDEPSHLDLSCLQRCLFWSARLKGLNQHLIQRHLSAGASLLYLNSYKTIVKRWLILIIVTQKQMYLSTYAGRRYILLISLVM